MLFVKSGTACTATTPVASFSYFALGAEVPPSAFVQAIEETES
jgi:hypothetical protein